MDSNSVQRLFNEVFNEFDGWALCNEAIKKMPYFNRVFLYDEASVESFARALEKTCPNENDIFYDLGSGLGKKVFAAALLCDKLHSKGIEILPDMYEASVQIQRTLHMRGHLVEKRVQFILGNYDEIDFTDASIIHISIFPFLLECQLYGSLGEKLKKLKTGTRIITSEVSLPLAEYAVSDIIDYVFPTRVEKAFIHWRL